MYVTRPLSLYKRDPDALSLRPEGPNSGYLVIQDEESETYRCFGMCKNRQLYGLPFPQNKDLAVQYLQSTGESTDVSNDEVMLIPVLNQPLSSNHYYAIKAHGKHKGEAYTCSREEDKTTCCFCRCVKDIKPRPLDPHDIYQKIEIVPRETMCNDGGYFYAKSIASDGYPPFFLRRKDWEIYASTPKNYKLLGDALGINTSLRERLPDFNISPSSTCSEAFVVGKWYCPFIFIKEGTPRDQMKRSAFYEMTLEQKWEQVFQSGNSYNEGNTVVVDVAVETEVVFVAGSKAVRTDNSVNADGTLWFTSSAASREESRVGLRQEIVDRMIWEEEKGGWSRGQARVQRAEEFGGLNGWREFGCYVLVESFVMKRMDGSVVMTYDFRHTHRSKCNWG